MIVFIDDQMFDVNDHKIMLVLTKKDKKNLAAMKEDAYLYGACSRSIGRKDLEAWMLTCRNIIEALPIQDLKRNENE